MNHLILTIVLSLFNPYINITFQKFSSTPFHLLFIILYSSPSYGSTPVLPGYLLLWHSCTWDKISIFWSCQVFGAVAGDVSYCVNYIFYFIFLFTFIVFLIFFYFFYFFSFLLHLHESLVVVDFVGNLHRLQKIWPKKIISRFIMRIIEL